MFVKVVWAFWPTAEIAAALLLSPCRPMSQMHAPWFFFSNPPPPMHERILANDAGSKLMVVGLWEEGPARAASCLCESCPLAVLAVTWLAWYLSSCCGKGSKHRFLMPRSGI
ncbi:hypothetical protein EV126DRAFT_138466 [Verticillium dahliae]|nr:hypothetical protein EV126DRAFT_138466 [Verticillium dahliae]